jgi:hypothetical protein
VNLSPTEAVQWVLLGYDGHRADQTIVLVDRHVYPEIERVIGREFDGNLLFGHFT